MCEYVCRRYKLILSVLFDYILFIELGFLFKFRVYQFSQVSFLVYFKNFLFLFLYFEVVDEFLYNIYLRGYQEREFLFLYLYGFIVGQVGVVLLEKVDVIGGF